METSCKSFVIDTAVTINLFDQTQYTIVLPKTNHYELQLGPELKIV